MMTGKEPGDLVRATLVVEDTFGYLTRVDVTGHAPLTEPPPSRSAIDVLPPGQQAPDVRLVDQDGTERHLSEWRGRVLAVTFIYTRCPLPDFCPLMDRQFAAPPSAKRRRTRNCGTDCTCSRSRWTRRSTRRRCFWRTRGSSALTRRHGLLPPATAEDLDRFGSRFGVSVMRNDPSGAEVIHNLRTAVLDRDGRLTTIFGGNDWSAADLLKELRRAVGNE